MTLDELEKLAKEVEFGAHALKRMSTLSVRELCVGFFHLLADNRAKDARIEKLERVAREYRDFKETMTAINQHMGYRFTQPIMNGTKALAALEDTK